MATTPASDASSPAVVKVSDQLTTVATASFTPPSNSCIVVGFTSDADNNTGTTPTITNSGTALTWTRVDSTGHGSAGDVGLCALFWAKVVTGAAMTVTVTHNLNGQTSNKPKMLVARVYPDTVVDIDDPIGVTAKGAFTSGTNMTSGTLTPETTAGGLRMLWLDWSATGTPTTFQSNTELVDSYHNAGLSTNVQIGKQTATTAGVGETIGATLLASSTDGNWIAYELRGATPADPGYGYLLLEGTADRVLIENTADLLLLDTNDPPPGGSNFTETANDAAGLTDSIVMQLGEIVTDSAGLVDTLAIARGEVVDDSAGLTDAIALARGEVVDDATGLTDAATVSFVKDQAADDSAGLTDAATLVRGYGLAQTDTAGVTDALVVDRGEVVDDSAGITDAAAIARTSVVNESAGLTDSVIVDSGTGALAQTDPAGLTDATTVDRAQTATDSTGAADSVALSLSRVVTDQAGTTDSAIVENGRLVPASDAAGLTDTVVLQLFKAITETAGLADLAAMTRGLAATDTAGLVDTVDVALAGPTVGAPAAERLVVEAESRTLVVERESRTLLVADEDRTIVVPAENRTMEA